MSGTSAPIIRIDPYHLSNRLQTTSTSTVNGDQPIDFVRLDLNPKNLQPDIDYLKALSTRGNNLLEVLLCSIYPKEGFRKSQELLARPPLINNPDEGTLAVQILEAMNQGGIATTDELRTFLKDNGPSLLYFATHKDYLIAQLGKLGVDISIPKVNYKTLVNLASLIKLASEAK